MAVGKEKDIGITIRVKAADNPINTGAGKV